MPLSKRVRHWAHGLGSAFITGGASALTAGAATALAPTVGIAIAPLDLKQMAVVFLGSGVFGAMAYLKQSPLPPEEETK